MKTKYIFLFGLVVAFSSCSTAYRTGQTPDDVYYSPAPVQNTYVVSENQDDRNSYRYRNQEEEDIRRGIRDSRYRSNVSISLGSGYSPYNNYGYNAYSYNPYNSLSPYSYGYNPMYDPYRFDPFFNPYTYNTYYNPYSYSKYGGNYYTGYYPAYSPVIIVPSTGRVNTNKGPRKYNLDSYNTSSPNNGVRTGGNYKPGTQPSSLPPVRTFKKPNEKSGTGVGNVLRRVFTPSENTNREYSPARNNNRQYTPGTNSTTTPSDGGRSSTAPARTFSNPPATTNSNPPASTAPVRTFRKN